MNRAILILALTALSLPVHAEHSKAVESVGLGRAVVVRGQLGQPLGKVIAIEGSAVGSDYKRSKADQSAILFRVTKVDGTPLPEPRVIRLSFFGFLSVRPPTDGEERTFRGYEDGGFSGIPNAALKEMDSIPQTADWYFSTHFRVIK
jgi:hypothetical protein